MTRHVPVLCLLITSLAALGCSPDDSDTTVPAARSIARSDDAARGVDASGPVAAQAEPEPKQPAPPPVPPAGAIDEFNQRVKAYLELRKKVANDVPDLTETKDTAKIVARKQSLAVGLRLARQDARQGDIFTPEVALHFRRLVNNDLNRRSDAAAKALLEEVPEKLRIRINDPYPEGAPLATMPPEILLRLPVLPEELEYRFLGRHLILRDVDANVILDFVYNVVPADKT